MVHYSCGKKLAIVIVGHFFLQKELTTNNRFLALFGHFQEFRHTTLLETHDQALLKVVLLNGNCLFCMGSSKENGILTVKVFKIKNNETGDDCASCLPPSCE